MNTTTPESVPRELTRTPLLSPATYGLAVLRPKIDDAAYQAHLQRVKASRAELFEIASEVFADAVRQSLDAPTFVVPLQVNVSIEMPPPYRGFEVKVQLAEVARATMRVRDEIAALGFRATFTRDEVGAFEMDGGYAPRTWEDIVDSGRAGTPAGPNAFSDRALRRIYPSNYSAGPRTCVQFRLSIPTE